MEASVKQEIMRIKVSDLKNKKASWEKMQTILQTVLLSGQKTASLLCIFAYASRFIQPLK